MSYNKRLCMLGIAVALGIIVMLLPRPEGSRFKVTGDRDKRLYAETAQYFKIASPANEEQGPDYILEAVNAGEMNATADFLRGKALESGLSKVRVDYVDGLSPKAQRFLAMLAVLVFLFVFEPIPLEITAICIGVFLVLMRVIDVKDAWAPYMHPVVVFIMCCLIFSVALDKVGLTRRVGYFIIKRAGSNVVKFTFILSIGMGLMSTLIHDAAACAIGIATILPLMRAAGIEPHTNTAKFMMLSLPFACSCGGMGTLIGGGRCMVASAFLKEFTGIELSFFSWMKYAMPAALLTVPIAVAVVYFVFRPETTINLPPFKESQGSWSVQEKKTLLIIAIVLLMWLTKGLHGFDYSVPGMLGVGALVISDVLKWEDIHENLEWGTTLFIFGGGISLGLAMAGSGAADYFAYLFFPLVQGKGWLLLFVGVGLFGAVITNAMANVAAAALILPIVIPMARFEGVDPTVLALCLGMATSFAMLLVIGCPPNAIAYSYRYFKASDLTKAGLVATPVLLAVITMVAGIWWKILGLV